jgi:hypothetical protein
LRRRPKRTVGRDRSPATRSVCGQRYLTPSARWASVLRRRAEPAVALGGTARHRAAPPIVASRGGLSRCSLPARQPHPRLSSQSMTARARFGIAVARSVRGGGGPASPRVPQLNGAPGHADHHRRRSPTWRHCETSRTLDTCSNRVRTKHQQRCRRGTYTRPAARDYDFGSADTPLRLLTCGESNSTHSSGSSTMDKLLADVPGDHGWAALRHP